MKVEVFDDGWSMGHALLGALSIAFPPLAIVFFGYELISFCVKRKKRGEKVSCFAKGETIRQFVGDLFEFLIGAGLAALFTACSGFPACIG